MKKLILLLAGGTMVLLSSCSVNREISGQPEFEKYKSIRYVHVLNASTKNDSAFFTDRMPGRMNKNDISGIHQLKLLNLKADSIFFKPVKYKRIVDYVYKNGIRYNVFEENRQLYAYNTADTLRIPYPEIEALHVKVYKPGRTVLLIGGSTGGLIGLFIIMLQNMTFNIDAGYII
jgi:hypothetical protein